MQSLRGFYGLEGERVGTDTYGGSVGHVQEGNVTFLLLE